MNHTTGTGTNGDNGTVRNPGATASGSSGSHGCHVSPSLSSSGRVYCNLTTRKPGHGHVTP